MSVDRPICVVRLVPSTCLLPRSIDRTWWLAVLRRLTSVDFLMGVVSVVRFRDVRFVDWVRQVEIRAWFAIVLITFK